MTEPQGEKTNVENRVKNMAEALKPHIESISKSIEGLTKAPSIENAVQLVISITEFVRALRNPNQVQQKEVVEKQQLGTDLPANIEQAIESATKQLEKSETQEKAQEKTIKELRVTRDALPATDTDGRAKLDTQISELQKQQVMMSTASAQLRARLGSHNIDRNFRVADVKSLTEQIAKNPNSPAVSVERTGDRLNVTLRQGFTLEQRQQFEKIQKEHPGLLSDIANGRSLSISVPGMFWSRTGPGANARRAIFDFLAGVTPQPVIKQQTDQKQQGETKEQGDKKWQGENKMIDILNKQQGENKMIDILNKQQGENKYQELKKVEQFNKEQGVKNQGQAKTDQLIVEQGIKKNQMADSQPFIKLQGENKQGFNPNGDAANNKLLKQQFEKNQEIGGKQSFEKINVNERQQTLDKLNATSERLAKMTADALDAFDTGATSATYKTCMDRANTERDHLDNMETVLPTILGGITLVTAMNQLNDRAVILNRIANENATLWESREARQKEITPRMNQLTTLVVSNDLVGAEKVIAELRELTGKWASADGIPAERFSGVMRAAEAVIAELRQRVALRKVAEEYRQTWLKQLPVNIEGAQKMIERRQKEFNDLRGAWYNPLALVDRGVSRVSGTSAGIEKSIAADQAHKGRMEDALRDLTRLSPLGANQDPRSRIENIQTILRGALTINYDDANKTLASAQAALKTTDAVIREVANWVPGGNLGIGIAEMRMNPNSPDAQRALMTGIAFAAIDCIPIPGLGAGVGFAARTTLRASARVVPRIAARVIARGTAVVVETGVKQVVQSTVKYGAEQAADYITGTEAQSKAGFENIPENISTNLVSEGVGYGTQGIVRLVTRSPRLAQLAGQAANKGTSAAFNNI